MMSHANQGLKGLHDKDSEPATPEQYLRVRAILERRSYSVEALATLAKEAREIPDACAQSFIVGARLKFYFPTNVSR